MTKKERQTVLDRMAACFATAQSGWSEIANMPGLPYLCRFFVRQAHEGCWLFVGFYNWRAERFSATVGWLSRRWHPREQELVERYLSADGSLKQIVARAGSKDFDHADFERPLGSLIPAKSGMTKSYDATLATADVVAAEMCRDIETAGFEYFDLMLHARHGKRLSDVFRNERAA